MIMGFTFIFVEKNSPEDGKEILERLAQGYEIISAVGDGRCVQYILKDQHLDLPGVKK
jgi:hypothetical protein